MTELDRDRLRAQLLRHESLRLRPYTDIAGKLTIGVGRNLTDVGVSADEAFLLLRDDIDRAERGLSVRFPWFASLGDVRQAALVNMAFNLGVAGVAGFPAMVAAITRGDFAQAATEMLASRWATQVGARASELATQMRTGVWA